jgi:hypothetical protein
MLSPHPTLAPLARQPLTASSDASQPTWRSPTLAKWAHQRQRCRVVFEGTDAMRIAADLAPKLPRESPDDYRTRLQMTELVNLFGVGVKTGAGLMLHQPPALSAEITDTRLAAIFQDIDGQQTGVTPWLRGVIQTHVLQQGWCVVLAASPVRAGTPVTRADEAEQQLRPYAVVYGADQVRSLRFQRVGGRMRLIQAVLEETYSDWLGAFGEKIRVQFRVLKYVAPGAHVSELWRETESGGYALTTTETIETQELPLVEFTAQPGSTWGIAPPPLLDLCDLTVSHFNILSDRRWSLKMACYPLPVRIGYTARAGGSNETAVGATQVMDLAKDGDFKWVAPPTEAMEPTETELRTIEQRAATLTLSFLAGESGAVQTATAKQIDQQAQDASLSAVAQSVRDSMNRLFALFDEILGNQPIDQYLDMDTTFRGVLRDPQYLQLLLEAWKEGGLPLDALLAALKTGDLPDDVDIDELALKAMAEAEANRQAEADRAAEAMEGQPPVGDDLGGDNARRAA